MGVDRGRSTSLSRCLKPILATMWANLACELCVRCCLQHAQRLQPLVQVFRGRRPPCVLPRCRCKYWSSHETIDEIGVSKIGTSSMHV